MYDVVIVGAGVSGCAIARELSRYDLKIAVLEKNEDVCTGTSKANSGIVHAGFDAKPGTLMAKLNVEGNRLMEQLSRDLDFPFRRVGSLVICFAEEEVSGLETLLQQGIQNGVPDLKILNQAELRAMEPNIAPEAYAALYAPTGGIVCPFGLTIAMAENAAVNGTEFHFNTPVDAITQADGIWELHSGSRVIPAKCVVNAAGVHADRIHNLVSSEPIEIIPRRGEYMLLDKAAGSFVSHTIFQLPGKFGKGVLVTPTVHGNLLVGPNAHDLPDKDATETTQEGLDEIAAKAARMTPGVPLRQVITSFAGLRAHEARHEFRIEEAAPGFFDCAAIESPGLTSAPAIGRYAAQMVLAHLPAREKPDFIPTRKGILDPFTLSDEALNALIRENPAYGTIVCRCETVTEGQIIDAIRRPLGATTVDGIKRRTRAGMGRCQAGFCLPRTMEILARETGKPMAEIVKNHPDSRWIPEDKKDV